MLRRYRIDLAILLLAAALRLFWLGIKPPHFDEGVNGWFVDQLRATGHYAYDPTNYHGPLHFYVLFLFQTLLGRTVWALRLPVVLVSLASIWLVLRFDRFIDRRACRLAALFFAVSPGFVFYGRYGIHEAWLVLFLMLALWGMVALWREGSRAGLAALATGITGMLLTKETYLIHGAAFLLAYPCLLLWEKFVPSTDAAEWGVAPRRWDGADFLYAVGCSLFALVFFYSGNFMNWDGLAGFVQALAAWAKTGTDGHGHEKPFHYWLVTLFFRYEWAGVLGLAACARLLWPAPRLARYLAIMGAGTLLAYSIVPYKTPWCIISILWPFLFLAACWLVEWKRWAGVAAAALLVGHALWWAVDLNYRRPTDDREPYVYVQTYPEIERFTRPLLELARLDPRWFHLRGGLVVESYYPLPWLLGDFPAVAYHPAGTVPDDLDLDFLLVDKDKIDRVEPKLRRRYFTEEVRVRNAQQPSKAYFDAARFAPLFPGREPEFSPGEGVTQ